MFNELYEYKKLSQRVGKRRRTARVRSHLICLSRHSSWKLKAMIRLEYFVRKARKELKKLLLLGTICSDEKNFESINGNYKIGCYVCKLINMMIIFSFNKLDSACRRCGRRTALDRCHRIVFLKERQLRNSLISHSYTLCIIWRDQPQGSPGLVFVRLSLFWQQI